MKWLALWFFILCLILCFIVMKYENINSNKNTIIQYQNLELRVKEAEIKLLKYKIDILEKKDTTVIENFSDIHEHQI